MTDPSSFLPEVPDNDDDRLAFLHAEDIPSAGAVLRLLGRGRPNSGKFGKGLLLEVELNGERIYWDIKFTSMNYRLLRRRFGAQLEDWTGDVKVVVKNHMGHDYVAVE